MEYILLFISISSVIFNNSLMSRVSKTLLHGKTDVFRFNSFTYLICVILFGLLAVGGGFSLYTVILAVLFGVATAFSNFYRTLALANGPTHITILITTSSLVIPTLSGVAMGLETFKPLKLLFIFVLLYFIYLSSKKSTDTKLGKGWLLYCSVAFIFQGIIGVIQKIHQSSQHKSELFQFLFISFIISMLYALLFGYSSKTKTRFTVRYYVFASISGICVFTMNYLNLKLSGIIPSQIFFPAVNGFAIIFTSLVAVVIFKEKLTRRQTIGLIGGLISLAAICIL